jgi:L-Ala-D/L-Glu epimerase
MKIVSVEIRHLRLPLVRPYRLSYRTFDEFEPYLVVVMADSGAIGFADAHIAPGSSRETRAGGWAFCRAMAPTMVGREPAAAIAGVLARAGDSKVAATALACAVEHLMASPLLTVPEETRLPLLSPVGSLDPAEIATEVEALLEAGYRAFKIKVGQDVEADLARVGAIQRAAAGRARLRIDANRAYSVEQGRRFAARLDPAAIELFEQPCAAEDWDANAAVAAVSTVPLMLDEPICGVADIERAATIRGVGLCKLKLKRFGSLRRLEDGLRLVSALGMEPVLGDGLGSEIHAWLEACVAARTIRNAGEFNGFLKAKARLFKNPLRFERGAIVLPPGYTPLLDSAAVEGHTVAHEKFGRD